MHSQLAFRSIAALLLATSFWAGPLLAADTKPPSSASPASPPGDVLMGKLNAVDQALESTIATLAQADMKRLAKSLRDLFTAYSAAADEVQTAFRASGAAVVQLNLACDVLDRTIDRKPLGKHQHLNAGVESLRDRLLVELAAARQRFSQAKSEEESQRALAQMRSSIESIGQLNTLIHSPDPATKAFVPHQDLKQSLQSLRTQIQQETKLLEVQSAALTGLVGQAVSEIETTLRTADLALNLPTESLARLRKTRHGVQSLIECVRQSRQAERTVLLKVVAQAKTTAQTSADALGVLNRAEQLLRSSSSPKACR